jgi:hypothetical protein
MKTRNLYTSMLSDLVDTEAKLKKLPPLTSVQKAKLDDARAIDHLYYSSKIEGIVLSSKRLAEAIHGNI